MDKLFYNENDMEKLVVKINEIVDWISIRDRERK